MNRPPDRIYLQWNCEEQDENWGHPDVGDVTWNSEPVFSDDEEYIRRYTVQDALDAAEVALNMAAAHVSPFQPQIMKAALDALEKIKELKP